MAKAIQRRRGTNTDHATFTGLLGEVTVNTTQHRLHVHDGSTAGGFAHALKSELWGLDAFVDPNADRLLFWDDSAGVLTSLTPPSALVITNTAAYIKESILVACSDETTAITAATDKVRFRLPYAFTLLEVRANLRTRQAGGSIFTVDINQTSGSPDSPVSILSTKLTIDNGEYSSITAATPAVLSSTSFADGTEISVDVDQIGDGSAKGLKIALIGYQT